MEDDEGVRSSSPDTIVVKVIDVPINNAPVAVISSPQTGSTFDSGQLIQFSSQGSTDLDGDDLFFIWSSSIDGEIFTTSSFFIEILLTDGIHLITLKVQDSNGGYDEVSVEVTVLLVAAKTADNNPIPSLGVIFVISVLIIVNLTKRKITYI